MKNNYFLIGIFNTFIASVFICGLSACAIENNHNKEIATIEQASDIKTPAINPLDIHQSLQPDLTNQECPFTLDNPSYRLGAEDEVTLKIYGENDLSGKYIIQNSGTVNIPLIGEITLSGCTLRQAEQLLFTKFTEGYLINPSIAIAISKHRPFYIIGEIREPGRYDYVVNMNVLQAVAIAGGFTYRANKKNAKILKGHENNKSIYEDLLVEKEINPGDVIFIKERFF